jgi:hypothetical protein
MMLDGRTVGIKPNAPNNKSTMMVALTIEANKMAVI